MKKIISLVLCLMMVLGMAAPVFAEEHNHTITIANDNVAHPTYVYKAYQVFSGVLDETGVLSNIDWGTGVNGTALLAALIIAAVTFFICMGGLVIGRTAGTRLAGRAGILGGTILIFIGIEIFVTNLF